MTFKKPEDVLVLADYPQHPLDDKMPIFIPTKGRTNDQKTFGWLPEEVRKYVVFVICPEEEEFFKEHYPEQRILVVEKSGVPAARQAVVDRCIEKSIPYAAFFDDDLRFCVRRDDWEYKTGRLLAAADVPGAILASFQWMRARIEDYAIAGLAGRGNNQGIADRWERVNSRQMRSFAVDVQVLAEEKIRFDKYLYWEDFHVTLSLLKRGYPNILSLNHVCDGQTNRDGGVSLYRNRDDLVRVREEFLAEHAPFAVANDQKSAAGWANTDDATMPDVKIFWRRSFCAEYQTKEEQQ